MSKITFSIAIVPKLSFCSWHFFHFPGGGLVDEGEVIEVVEMTIPQVEAYVDAPDNLSPPGFLFGLLWFLRNKAPKK